MEHPLIGDINHLTTDELQSKISELNKKMQFALRTGNSHLIGQLRMAIETFSNKYQQRLREEWESKHGKGPDYSDRIDIS